MEKISGTPEQLIHRRELVDALRSGKYKQTTHQLTKDGGFCCLGVGCDISKLGVWEGPRYVIDREDENCFSSLSLPDPVAVYFGMTTTGNFTYEGWPIVEYGDNDAAVELSSLNDGARWSFLQIADFIEERWEVAPASA